MAPVAPPDEYLSLTKACNPCRLLKIRCVIETGSGQKSCQRCIRIGKDCTFPAVQRRRQRKRTDVRVADLENEIRSMKGLLGQDRAVDDSPRLGRSNGIPAAPSMDTTSGVVQNDTDGVSSQHSPSELVSNRSNIPDAAVMNDELAKELYNVYKFDLVGHYPLVSFSDDYSVQSLRTERPTLFLAVMAAAARKSHPQISTMLNKQVLQSYATRVFMNSEKSLELVQAMIVTVVWYSPPDGFGSGQHKFYEYIHMAATMALDLGLEPNSSQAEGSVPAAPHSSSLQRSSTSSIEPIGLKENERPSLVPQEPNSYEAENEIMRTRLSCFVLCCGVALSMRRPNMLKFNDWVAGGVKHFQSSSSASIPDQRLVAWVRLLKIADDISTDLSFNDLEHIAKITDLNTLTSLQKFEKLLQDWRDDLTPGILNGSLELSYHYLGIYLHEIALHDGQSPGDFVPPFSFEKIRSHSTKSYLSSLNLGATLHCITSAHALIETFLHMDVESLRTLPIFFYVRLSYAMFILEIVTAPSTSSDALYDPYSLITRHSIQIDSYLTLSIKHLKRVVAHLSCAIPSMFLDMFLKLQQWHERNAESLNIWLGADAQRPMLSVGTSTTTSKSPSSAQQGSMEDRNSNPTDTSNNTGVLDNNLQRSNVVTPDAGWTCSAYPVVTPSQTTTPYSSHHCTDQTFSSFPNKWNSQATQLDSPPGIDSNFDLSGDFEMDFDPSNLFLFNDEIENMQTNNT